MPVFRDRVKDTTTTTGTGAVTLSGTAPTGYQTFTNAYPILGTPFAYCIAGGAEWETGTGYLSASTTLVRDTVEDGSSGLGAAVSFSAGTKDVFVTVPAVEVRASSRGNIVAKINGLAMP